MSLITVLITDNVGYACIITLYFLGMSSKLLIIMERAFLKKTQFNICLLNIYVLFQPMDGTEKPVIYESSEETQTWYLSNLWNNFKLFLSDFWVNVYHTWWHISIPSHWNIQVYEQQAAISNHTYTQNVHNNVTNQILPFYACLTISHKMCKIQNLQDPMWIGHQDQRLVFWTFGFVPQSILSELPCHQNVTKFVLQHTFLKFVSHWPLY